MNSVEMNLKNTYVTERNSKDTHVATGIASPRADARKGATAPVITKGQKGGEISKLHYLQNFLRLLKICSLDMLKSSGT